MSWTLLLALFTYCKNHADWYSIIYIGMISSIIYIFNNLAPFYFLLFYPFFLWCVTVILFLYLLGLIKDSFELTKDSFIKGFLMFGRAINYMLYDGYKLSCLCYWGLILQVWAYAKPLLLFIYKDCLISIFLESNILML